EDMAAHLAGEGRAGLGHLRLDQRMAGLPHKGLAAGARDLVEQDLARLDIRNDGDPGMSRQDFAGEEHHHLVGPEYAPGSVDGTDAVAVAVEGNAKIAALLGDGGADLREIFRHGGIRMMVWKAPVDGLIQ